MADDRAFRLPTGAVAVLVFVGSLIALLVLFRSDGAPDVPGLLGDHGPAAVEARVRERLSTVELRPSAGLRVRGRRIEWRDGAGRPFLSAPVLTFTIRLGGPDGAVLIEDGVARSPEVRLVEVAPGEWNYEGPLGPFLEDGGRGTDGRSAEVAVRMRDVRLQDGHVVLEMLDATYEARSLDARVSSARLSGPGLDAPVFRVAGAEATLVLPDTGDATVTRPVAVSDATLRLVDGALAFEAAEATFGGSRFADAGGVWDPDLDGLGLDATMTATRARVADLPWLRGEVPEDATGSFRLALEPRPGDRTALRMTDLELRAPGSSATGSMVAVLGGDAPVLESIDVRVDPLSLDLVEAFTGPLPYGGQVSGVIRGGGGEIEFDLRGALTTSAAAEPFVTDLTGQVRVTEAGVEVRTVTAGLDRVPLAALEALVPGLPLGGMVSGSIRMDGSPDAAPLGIDIRLEAGGGVITADGTVDLTGAVPSYDLAGRLVGVDLRRVVEPSVPPVQLHGEFELEGAGTDPTTADARLRVAAAFTGWQSEPGDTLVVAAELGGGRLEIPELRLDLGPVHLGAGGTWQLAGGGGSVRYDLVVESLTPLGPYLPTAGAAAGLSRGRVEAEGTVAGTLDAPVVEGTAAAGDVRHGPWAAESFEAAYAVDLTGPGLPAVRVELSGQELSTTAGDFDAARLDLRFARPTFDLAFEADQRDGAGIVQVEAEGRIEESGGREVLIRTAEVDLAEQRWRLPAPARIAWTRGEAVRVEDLLLRQVEGDGRVRVEGVVAPLDDLDVALDITRLPVGDVLRLVGSDLDLAGELALEGSLRGPAEAPELDVRLGLTDGAVRGVAIRSVDATVRYATATLDVEGTGALGDSARVELRGTVPTRLRLAGGPMFELVDERSIDLRLVTETFPLATLDPGIATVEELAGRLEADLHLGGTPGAPQLSGSARVSAGAFTVPRLDRRFDGVTGAVELSGRRATIRELAIRSDGTARVTGTVAFEELTDPSFDLAIELNRFRVQGVEDEEAAATYGTLRLGGTLDAPVLGGDILARDGAVSLAPFREPDLNAQLAGGSRGLNVPGDVGLDFGDPGVGRGFVIRDLEVRAGENLWFVTDEARVRLAGTLIVEDAGNDVTLQGTLEGDLGTFQLEVGPITRQFQITAAEIRFFGTPSPNPRVDITASRVVRTPDRGEVTIQARVTGTFQNPSLTLSTARGGAIPESELLSFLLFGRSSSELAQVEGGVGGVVTQGLAYTGLTERFGAQLAEQSSLIDYFRIEPSITGTGLVATAGSDLGSGLFASVELPLGDADESGGVSASAVRLDWRISRQWTMELAYEPVNRLHGTGSLPFFADQALQKQLFIASRWRWTY